MATAFQWLIVTVLVLVIFLFIKVKYLKHKLTWIALLILILMSYVGFLASTSGQDLDLSTFNGSQTATKLYFSWLGNSFENMKVLTGQATKLDWSSNTTQILERIP